MFENALTQLALVAAFVQKFVAIVKPLYQQTPYQKYFDMTLAVVVSAFLCISWQIDIFAVADLVFFLPWLGAAFTGVIAALGASVLNDVLVLLEMWKNQKKAEAVLTTVVAVNATEVALEVTDEEPKG